MSPVITTAIAIVKGRKGGSAMAAACVNALASEQQKVAVLGARIAVLEDEAAQCQRQLGAQLDSNAQLQARLTFRESLPGWLRWPLARLKARFAQAR